MSEYLPNGEAITNLIASRISKGAQAGAVDSVQLAERIGEIEIETQTTGASLLKVHIIDPDWTLITSGWLDVKEGLLEPIEIEFPDKSNWKWIICAAEGSFGEAAESNLVVTFEDRLVSYLRSYWKEKTAPAGTQTRAEFIRDLVAEVGSRGEEPIRFVCPALTIEQPLETETEYEAKKKSSKTKSAEAEEKATLNKSKNTDKLTANQYIFAGDLASATGLNSRVVAAWCLSEESGGAATSRENEGNNNWLNIGYFDSGPGEIAFNTAFKNPGKAAQFTAQFLKGEKGGASQSIREILKSTKQSPQDQITAIVNSDWASSHYDGGGGFRQLFAEITEGPVGSSESSGTENKSDVSQLARGTSSNPDEDSWECCIRLAQQVDWSFFSNMDVVYYIDGPDLMRQTPSLYVDIPRNHVRRHNEKPTQGEYGVIVSPTTFTWDNTAFEYRQTHKLKPRTPRKSKQVKPSSPAEVKLLLECSITAFRAGDVFKFENSGSINGVWIVTDTKRNCLKDTYTEIILEPPIEPLPEPKATEESEVEGTNSQVSSKNLPSGVQTPTTEWNPEKKPIAAWIVPILEWASKHGWVGTVTSGYRTNSEQIAAANTYAASLGKTVAEVYPDGPLASNHCKTTYPGGAIDTGQYSSLVQVLKNYPNKPNLVWGGTTIEDSVHFSATGH